MKQKKRVLANRRGIAIAVVLVFCVGILGLVGVLVMNTRFQKGSHSIQYQQTRALMAAKAAMQLAIYKFRVLPSEFYKLHKLEKALKDSPGDPVLFAKVREFERIWNLDFDSEIAGSPAAKIKQRMNSADDQIVGPQHAFRVTEFKLVSSGSRFEKDYLKIRTVGIYGTSQKILEELIEIQVAD